MFGCSQRVRVLLFEMLSISACLENQKVQRKGRITWKQTNKTGNNRWDISSLREVMFHHKLDAICSKLFFFGLFSLTLNVQKLFVKLCHSCNFAVKNQLQTDSNVQASH